MLAACPNTFSFHRMMPDARCPRPDAYDFARTLGRFLSETDDPRPILGRGSWNGRAAARGCYSTLPPNRSRGGKVPLQPVWSSGSDGKLSPTAFTVPEMDMLSETVNCTVQRISPLSGNGSGPQVTPSAKSATGTGGVNGPPPRKMIGQSAWRSPSTSLSQLK